MQPRTCVITVNYKSADTTASCIASLERSSVPVMTVVVDNSPEDPELRHSLAPFPNTYLIFAPENLGFGGGNNLGIDWALKNSGCEFVLILNNDTIVEEDTIAKLEATLDNFPDAGMATSRIVFLGNSNVLWYGGGEISWSRGAAVAPGYLGESDSTLAMHAREVSFASGCVMLVRRNVMQQLGGFDERFFMYEEDVELCLRMREFGWRIQYEPSALVHHVVQASTSGEQGFVDRFSPLNENLPFYIYHSVRNRLINMHLHAKGINRLVFVAGFSALLFKKALQYSIYFRWDGIAAIIRGFEDYRKCIASNCSDNNGGASNGHKNFANLSRK